MRALPVLWVLGTVPAVAHAAAAANPALTITEHDQDGDSTVVTTDASVVDINSVLELKLDRMELSARAADLGAGSPPEGLASDLQLLDAALEHAAAAVAPLNDAIVRFAGKEPGADEALRNATRAAATSFQAISALARVTGLQGDAAVRRRRFRDALNAAIDANSQRPAGQRLSAYVEVARAHLATLKSEFQATATQQGVYIQMGAWVATRSTQRAVHIPGFDVYPEGERFTVDRWAVAFTDEQRKQLERAAEFAKSFNEKGLSATARAAMQGIVGEALQVAQRSTDAARAAIDTYRADIGSIAAEVKVPLDAVESDVNDVRTLAAALATKYTTHSSTSSAATFLEGTTSDIQSLVSGATKLVNDLHSLSNALKAQVKKSVAAATKLAAALDQARLTLQTDVLNALDPIRDSIAGMLGVSRLAEDAGAFGAEVKKLDIASLPDAASLDLVTTGRREPGDVVLIKLSMGRADKPRRDLVTRRLAMYKVLLHIDTAVTVLFASPLQKTVARGFQAAPSYSLILRAGSRYHPTIDALWTPGVGLNLTALNFRHNDTPELGVGLAVSFLRDYLQAGVGYNVFADRFYAFFGLGLPLPNLGGASVSPTGTTATTSQ